MGTLNTQNSIPPTHKGFTLLEVVVAMAIVGLGVVTLLELFSRDLRLGWKSSEKTEAAAYSVQFMNRVLIRRTLQEGGGRESSGDGYRWRLEIQTLPQEEPALLRSNRWELKEITLRMRYGNRGRGRPLAMKTLRLVKKNP
ncbi:MAG: prepilin-type N-terminal cleavage/methylation domain-containing protein [Candidatus Binatia bacterium]